MTEAKPGRPFPTGATWDGEGTNFSLFSEHAARVELCLFDAEGRETRVEVSERTADNWHCFVPGIGPGQRYGYRVYGPYTPADGHRFNATKLLIDPYARAIDGPVRWERADPFPYVADGSPDADLRPDTDDSADAIPRCVVVDPSFAWEDDRLLRTPFAETVIYELHVKGFTALHPRIREELRGTYAGLASEPAIDYLQSLGVTAVELLPVHQIADEGFLVGTGLKNYWGYSSVGYFAPHSAYAATGTRGEQVREFKGMVKALHQAGIEVILDVVYNHTAEGNHLGPMLSLRGIDNASYYRLKPDDPRYYMDFTGTGNTVNTVHPSVLRLVMDSLRYWVTECHVDGFRFDLASALARELHDFNPRSAFLEAIHQDPVLSQVKLIAEPWDIGHGGYQVGHFPVLWSEWNGVYRDTMRDFWRGHAGLAEFSRRFAGSSDLYDRGGRGPTASINFVTAHDGFPLNDLVSYNERHNEANLEQNMDGATDNRSWNCGVEGRTDDPEIRALRERQQRNFLASLLLSQGVPMLLGGDERARTQHGNNNAWCQDNEISWLDWDLDEDAHRQLAFARKVIALRHAHPVFRRDRFLTGLQLMGSGLPDAWWFRADGRQMAKADWQRPDNHLLGVFLNGREITDRTPDGEHVIDDSFLVLLNAGGEEATLTLPARRFGALWELELSTAEPELEPGSMAAAAREEVRVAAQSLVLFRRAR